MISPPNTAEAARCANAGKRLGGLVGCLFKAKIALSLIQEVLHYEPKVFNRTDSVLKVFIMKAGFGNWEDQNFIVPHQINPVSGISELVFYKTSAKSSACHSVKCKHKAGASITVKRARLGFESQFFSMTSFLSLQIYSPLPPILGVKKIQS